MIRSLVLVVGLLSSLSFANLPSSTSLYNKPHYNRTGFCDKYTDMQVSGNVARLRNRLSGTCEILVRPDERTYTLSPGEDDGCGSIIYTGRSRDRRLIEITDNTKRTCENIIPALIVVREFDDTSSVTRYSNP
jgi:hypothetical protein